MATNKKITIGAASFSASDPGKILQGPSISESISPVLLDLPWDVFEFAVRSSMVGKRYFISNEGHYLCTNLGARLTVDAGDLLKTEQGTEIEVFEGQDLRDKFYFQSAKGRPNMAFDIKAYSAIGILEQQFFMGAFWQSQTVETIVGDIIDGAVPYTIADNVKSLVMSFPLGPMTKRRALSAVLLATGASIMKDAGGDITIAYNQQSDALPLAPIGIGGQRLDYARATDVTVTEHSFYTSAAAEEEVLFDNTNDINVTGQTILFDEPVQSYRVDGSLTLDASGPYYATLTGVGVLYGVKYVHVKRDITDTTGITGAKNELRVDCTAVSPANSQTVLDRVINYEANVQLSQVDALVTTEKAGDLVTYRDPYDGDCTGYIIKLNKTLSGQDKAQLTIAKNWTPGSFGNAYDSYIIVTEDDLVGGAWQVPAEIQGLEGLVVLFSGAQGGQGGHAGQSPGISGGRTGELHYNHTESGLDTYDSYLGGLTRQMQGGAGGLGGAGGAAASKILNININSFAASYPVSFGAGGLGGAGGTPDTDPEDGLPGDHSVFDTTNDTDDGANFSGTYINLVTGEVIAADGASGTAGAAGGAGGLALQRAGTSANSYAYTTQGQGGPGGSVGAYTGGSGANGARGMKADVGSGQEWVANGGGGGGGGAALGNNGSAGSTPTTDQTSHSSSWTDAQGRTHIETTYYISNNSIKDANGTVTYYGAVGGNGGDATIVPSQPVFVGGTGGAGGGGGGGAGQGCAGQMISYGDTYYTYGATRGGIGGNGGQGGQGSNGFMVVYYKATA